MPKLLENNWNDIVLSLAVTSLVFMSPLKIFIVKHEKRLLLPYFFPQFFRTPNKTLSPISHIPLPISHFSYYSSPLPFFLPFFFSFSLTHLSSRTSPICLRPLPPLGAILARGLSLHCRIFFR